MEVNSGQPGYQEGQLFITIKLLAYLTDIHIALDKVLFSTKKCLYFSYFSTKTYVVGTH